MKIGKVFLTTGKIIGTVAIGGAGVVAGILESGTSSASKDLSGGLGQVKETCFNSVKKIWDEESSSTDIAESVLSIPAQLVDINKALKNVQSDKREEYLNDPEKMRGLLKQYGKDPDLVDNPEFMRKLKEKWMES